MECHVFARVLQRVNYSGAFQALSWRHQFVAESWSVPSMGPRSHRRRAHDPAVAKGYWSSASVTAHNGWFYSKGRQ